MLNKLFSVTKKLDTEKKILKYKLNILGIKLSFKRKWLVNAKGNPIFYQFALQYLEESAPDKEEHKKLVANLYRNIDEEAKKNLDDILNRMRRIVTLANENKSYTNEYVYSKEEQEELKKVGKFFSEIKEEDGVFKLKHYILPENIYTPSVYYYHHGIDKLKTFDKFKASGKAILDVGTCIADSVLIFRDYCDNPIIGFEPVTDVHQKAMKTLELNNIKNCKIEQFALGDKEEEATIHITPGKSDWGTILNRPTEATETIKIRRLDDYVAENNVQVGLIKVDVEGFEPKFLEGAINTLKTQKPILLLSIYHNYNDFYRLKPWIEDLNLGYKFDFHKGVDGDPASEIFLLAEVR